MCPVERNQALNFGSVHGNLVVLKDLIESVASMPGLEQIPGAFGEVWYAEFLLCVDANMLKPAAHVVTLQVKRVIEIKNNAKLRHGHGQCPRRFALEERLHHRSEASSGHPPSDLQTLMRRAAATPPASTSGSQLLRDEPTDIHLQIVHLFPLLVVSRLGRGSTEYSAARKPQAAALQSEC